MQLNKYKCPGCKNSLRENEIEQHISLCGSYPSNILRQIKRLPKEVSIDELKFFLSQCHLAASFIRNRINLVVSPSYKPNISDIYSMGFKQSTIPIYADQDDLLECVKCNLKFIDLTTLRCMDDCPHFICVDCLRKHIERNFVMKDGVLSCLSDKCTALISVSILKEIVGESRYKELSAKADSKVFGKENPVECEKCKEVFCIVPGNPKDAPKKDGTGKLIQAVHAEHYAEYRFSCRKCRTDQCKGCKAVPYHFGRTCAEHKAYSDNKKCRYCLDLMDCVVSKEPALADVCAKKDCQNMANGACTKVQACGHPCYGYRNETKCLPCLEQHCAKKNKELSQNGVDEGNFCNVCCVDGLGAAPCVQIKCGHVFHVHCLAKSFQTRWLTPRIFFHFLMCPLCKADINVPADSFLSELVINNISLRQKIKEMASKRLKFQELQKTDPKLQPTGNYYKKEQQYAMAIYAYFQCFKCKKPYYGGRKDCAAAMVDPRGKEEKFDSKELVCPSCCPVPITHCPKHNDDFIEFKCRFCCQVAQWFCWGNTHFCDDCHKKQCNAIYLNKMPKQSLPKCQGVGKCPVGGNHDGNGDQKALGCSICRSYRDNAKEY